MRSPSTRSASHLLPAAARCSTAPCRSEMAVTLTGGPGRAAGRSMLTPRRRVASGVMEPVRAVLFDYGHTLVDFRRTEEALRQAYQRVRDRIEAVAYMEVPEILDLIERVAGGVDALVAESYREARL